MSCPIDCIIYYEKRIDQFDFSSSWNLFPIFGIRQCRFWEFIKFAQDWFLHIFEEPAVNITKMYYTLTCRPGACPRLPPFSHPGTGMKIRSWYVISILPFLHDYGIMKKITNYQLLGIYSDFKIFFPYLITAAYTYFVRTRSFK